MHGQLFLRLIETTILVHRSLPEQFVATISQASETDPEATLVPDRGKAPALKNTDKVLSKDEMSKLNC